MSEYTKDLEINEFNLEYCWVRQPMLYDKWGRAWARASFAFKSLERKRKLMKAKLSREIRENPSAFGWNDNKTPSLGFLDEALRLDPRFQTIDKAYHKARYDMETMEVAKDAFLHRRKALENLTYLYSNRYYHKEDIGSQVNEMLQDGVRETQKKKLLENPRMKRIAEGQDGRTIE